MSATDTGRLDRTANTATGTPRLVVATVAIPKPEPKDWQIANAQELHATDREVLAMLRDARKRVDAELQALLALNRSNISDGIKRARLEQSRMVLMREQAAVFERLGEITEARRLRSAVRAQRLSAAADAALLRLVGRTTDAQTLYDAALQSSQRAVDVALQRMRFSALPLSQRVYNTGVWMNGRLNKLINETLATGLNAREFARNARDWFNPNTPGGIRYAAMRLARTEINNAFHSMSVEKAAAKPWVKDMEWNLSKSHPAPDICNKVADDSPYPVGKVPARPHPQCMCYVTEAEVDEDEWIDRFVEGEFDDYLDDELEKAGVAKETPPPTPAKQPTPKTSMPEAPAPKAAEIAAKAEAEYVPRSKREPVIDDFEQGRFANSILGYNGTDRSMPEAEVFDKMTDQILGFLQFETFLPSRLQFLRAVDAKHAERSGTPNDHFFERKMVAYLGTPEGVSKSREVDVKVATELQKLEKADQLSRAAELLNGKQPDLPADSADFKEWSPQEAKDFWDRATKNAPLTTEQEKGLQFYSTTPGYTTMNAHLRGIFKGSAKERAKVEAALPGARAGFRPLDEPIVVQRATDARQLKDYGGTTKRLADLAGMNGKTFSDLAFTSTSFSAKFENELNLEIELPAGLPVVYMEGLTRHKGEKEILLPEGVEYTVLRTIVDGKVARMRVRVTNWPGKGA